MVRFTQSLLMRQDVRKGGGELASEPGTGKRSGENR
jgi:hypothetical protein